MKRLISVCVLFAIICSLSGCCCIRSNIHGTESPAFDSVDDLLDYENSDMPATQAPIEDEADDWYEDFENFVTEDPETENLEDQVISDAIYLDGEYLHRINLFLSNFAEAGIFQYPCCDYHMLKFVLSHCEINGVGDVRYSDGMSYFSSDTAETILYKYTGTEIYEFDNYNYYQSCLDSNDYFTYNDGYYYCQTSGGEWTAYVAVADEMYLHPDGTYTVYYSVYSVNPDLAYYYDFSQFYSYNSVQAGNDFDLAYCYSAVAEVCDYTRPSGQESFQLISLYRY